MPQTAHSKILTQGSVNPALMARFIRRHRRAEAGYLAGSDPNPIGLASSHSYPERTTMRIEVNAQPRRYAVPMIIDGVPLKRIAKKDNAR